MTHPCEDGCIRARQFAFEPICEYGECKVDKEAKPFDAIENPCAERCQYALDVALDIEEVK